MRRPELLLIEAVKAYRDETGLGSIQAKAVVDSYRTSKPKLQQNDTVEWAHRRLQRARSAREHEVISKVSSKAVSE